MSDDGDSSNKETGLIARLREVFSNRAEPDTTSSAAAVEENPPQQNFVEARREMIARVVAFDEKTVFDVMAPRADIYAVDIETRLDELIKIFAEAGHSRMPIFRGDLDDPIGMVHIKDVMGLIAGMKPDVRAEPGILKTIRRDVLYVPPSMRVTDLLLRMQASRIHMALVIDEYGGTDGLVTIEDLVEEIVGEINDEHDDEDIVSITPVNGGGWEVDARVELADFTDETGFHLQTDDDEIDTVGGYVVSLAGRVPQRGEVLPGPDEFDFEVIEADARKVRKVRIRPAAQEPGKAAE